MGTAPSHYMITFETYGGNSEQVSEFYVRSVEKTLARHASKFTRAFNHTLLFSTSCHRMKEELLTVLEAVQDMYGRESLHAIMVRIDPLYKVTGHMLNTKWDVIDEVVERIDGRILMVERMCSH